MLWRVVRQLSGCGCRRLQWWSAVGTAVPRWKHTDVADEQYAEQQRRNRAAGHMTELVRDFLQPADFHRALAHIGVSFYCGVPDSLLKDFCAYVTSQVSESQHVLTSSEGAAVALATGYHLATGKIPLVYMQNSGLGNAVNPLMSLAHPEVYSVPMLLLVGWRGEPGKRDEPQHMVQGKATTGMLETMGIPYLTLPDYLAGAERALETARRNMLQSQGPFALLVKRQTFTPYPLDDQRPVFNCALTREDAVQAVVDALSDEDVVVSTTGMTSRELFEHRVTRQQGHERDFLTVGSMGHASSIALGIALHKPHRQVVCVDGDGALLMHAGALAIIGQRRPDNLKHVLINNGGHDSVGGQPSAAAQPDCLNITQMALACGYNEVWLAETASEVRLALAALRASVGPALLEIRVAPGARADLGRPTRTPLQNKVDLMQFLNMP